MTFPYSTVLVALTMTIAGYSFDAAGDDAGNKEATKSQPRPMELADLLKTLPDCPAEWIIKRSQARTMYREKSLEAYAIREYEKVASAVGARKDNGASKPETVVMAIRDTCGSGPHLETFRKEAEHPPGGDFEMKVWNNYPGMLVRLGKNRRAFRILVADRFVVEVVSFGEDIESIDQWLEACDLEALTGTDQQNVISLRERIWISFLDELNPDRSSRYQVDIDSGNPTVPIPFFDPTIPGNGEETNGVDLRPPT